MLQRNQYATNMSARPFNSNCMTFSDSPEKLESEIYSLIELLGIVLRARIRGDQPSSFIENTIRDMRMHINEAVRRNKDLRGHMHLIHEKIKQETNEKVEKAKAAGKPIQFRRFASMLRDTAAALRVPKETVSSACIEDDTIVKLETSTDSFATPNNEHRGNKDGLD